MIGGSLVVHCGEQWQAGLVFVLFGSLVLVYWLL
jgi:hypothetical protein